MVTALTHAIGGKFLADRKDDGSDDALHGNEMVADLCQTATIVRVFLWWRWRFLAKPEDRLFESAFVRKVKREPGVCSLPLFLPASFGDFKV